MAWAGELCLSQKLPLASYFDKKADSVTINLKVGLTSRDNDPARDYTPNYSPIDFRNNDTIRTTYNLFSYYAYDDGEAEYGAGVNQAGAELAYQFDMKTTEPDALRAVNIYFPDFGDQSNQVFELTIWKSITDTPNILYKQTVSVKRSTKNKFMTYTLDPAQPVVVQGSFFVGWKQASSSRMDVGYDANTITGDKIYYNTTGTWTKNTDLQGSLMIRPVFGKAPEKVITAVNENNSGSYIYPNPSDGIFFIPATTSQIYIYDATGTAIDFLDTPSHERKIEITNRTGLFIVRLLINGQWVSQRIIVK